jgi:hypothetical protein
VPRGRAGYESPVTQTLPAVEPARGDHHYRIAHAEDPAQPGFALCGCKLSGKPTSASSERCVVCLDLTRRSFVGR